jgi:hypothetical protein
MNADDFNRAQSNYDNQLPPEPAAEPTEAHFDEAFDQLVNDDELIEQYIEECAPNITAIFQLYHHNGFPRMNRSEKDDELRDSYDTIFTHFLDGYRDWLGSRLAETAEAIMDQEIHDAKEDAAAELAYEIHRNSLNGGW